jgi:prophage regulatory protein
MLYQLSTVVKLVTLSKCTIYRLIKAGLFPKPIKLSPGRVAWRKIDIEEWEEKQVQSKEMMLDAAGRQS